MKAKQYQTILDLAIQTAGSVEAAFGLALLNGLSLTDDLSAGKEVNLPTVVDVEVLNYFTQKGIFPATAVVHAIDRIIIPAPVSVIDAPVINNLVHVLENQTLLDVALQTTGSIDTALQMALLNGLSITDNVEGMQLAILPVENKRIQAYYYQKGINPATGISAVTHVVVGRVFDQTFDFTFN